jgi:hypothetical protein
MRSSCCDAGSRTRSPMRACSRRRARWHRHVISSIVASSSSATSAWSEPPAVATGTCRRRYGRTAHHGRCTRRIESRSERASAGPTDWSTMHQAWGGVRSRVSGGMVPSSSAQPQSRHPSRRKTWSAYASGSIGRCFAPCVGILAPAMRTSHDAARFA